MYNGSILEKFARIRAFESRGSKKEMSQQEMRKKVFALIVGIHNDFFKKVTILIHKGGF
jgi:hypothetical protein